MLQSVFVNRFDSEASGGATEPFIASCLGPDGKQLDVVVKFSWDGCPVGGLIREAITAQLAKDLEMPVATPVLVHVDRAELDQISGLTPLLRKVSFRASRSVLPAYGSVHLGPGCRLCRLDALAPEMYESAVEIWAFDQLTLNPDRNSRKPNCLIQNDKLWMIDHEKALNVAGVGAFVPPPWQDGALGELKAAGNSEFLHLFHTLANSRSSALQRLYRIWKTLDVERIATYVDGIPQTWRFENDITEKIVEYLVSLQSNLDLAFEQLRRVTS